MLVVIAIIAVLVALLFPALGMMRKRSDQATCISNLRQLAIAANLASQQNDGRFPTMRGYNWEPPYDDPNAWIAYKLNPYLGGVTGTDPVKVLRCPAAERNSREDWMKESKLAHYRFNIFYGQDQRPREASAAMLFFDTTYLDWTPEQFSHAPGGGASVNAVYADGHAVPLTYSQFKKLNPSSDESQNDFFELGWVK
jgi:prepilin-type processing-associated H-X9-DG protein